MLAQATHGLGAATGIVSAVLFLVLAAAAMRRAPSAHPGFILALLATAAWLLAGLWAGPGSALALCGEAASNLMWLWFMASLADRDRAEHGISAVGWIYVGLFAVQSVVLAAIVLPLALGVSPALAVTGFDTIQMLFAAGALVLLHNLYDASSGDERQMLIWPLAALVLTWVYALNLHAIAYLSGAPATLMLAVRPLVMTLVGAMFAVAALRPQQRAVHLSRPVMFRSLALVAIGGWLGLLALLAMLLSATGVAFGALAQSLILVGTIAGAGLFLLSSRLRAHLRVWTAKHFYEHRYDYRAEWLRFTATLNRGAGESRSIDHRALKAIADIVESPSGMLVSRSGEIIAVTATSPWVALRPDATEWTGLFEWLEASRRIVQLDDVRSGVSPADEIGSVPVWLAQDNQCWVVVPLIHMDRIEAVVVLERPLVNRPLDWEDFDLLKVAGRQAASHIAEARGSAALAESERFEEFHRRFAFVMHDVKNLASQMALLSRNAERHGDNPKFREDMVATLQVCADRLGQMMQRLSQQERVRVDKLEQVDLSAAARRAADGRRSIHPIEVSGPASVLAWGDREVIEQVLAHLIQNGIDASAPDAMLWLRVEQAGDEAIIKVEDAGCGMSPEFVRGQLFRPFRSTKDGGFGIGTYQARQLAQAMGGTLSVTSRQGEGSTFTLSLKSYAVQAAPNPNHDDQSEAA